MKNLKILSRRGFALFVALAMCLSLMNLTAFAASEDGGDESQVVESSSSGDSSTDTNENTSDEGGSHVTEDDGNVTEDDGSVTEGDSDVTEGDSDVTEGDGNVTEDDGSVSEGGSDVTEGDGSVTEGDGSVSEGGSDVTEGDGDVTEGDGDVTEGGSDVTEGDGSVSEGDGNVSEGDGSVQTPVEEEASSALAAFLSKTEAIGSGELDMDGILAAIDDCLSSYEQLSEEEKAALADAYAALLAYQGELIGEQPSPIAPQLSLQYSDEVQAFLNAVDAVATHLKSYQLTGNRAAEYTNLDTAARNAYEAVQTAGDQDQPEVTEALARLTVLEEHAGRLTAFFQAAAAVEAVLNDPPLTAEKAEKYDALAAELQKAFDAVKDEWELGLSGVEYKFGIITDNGKQLPVLVAFFDAVGAVEQLAPITRENAAQCVELAAAAQEAYAAVQTAGAQERPGVQDALARLNSLETLANLLVSGEKLPVTDTASLQLALACGVNPIVLEDSFSVSETISVTGEVTLDLNGKTLTWENAANVNNSSLFRVESGGVLTITDSTDTVGYTTDYTVMTSTVNGEATAETTETRTASAMGGTITLQKELFTGGDENLSAIIIVSGGKLVMANGVIDGAERRLARGVLVDNGGSVSMEGGAIVHCAARAYGNPYGSGVFVRNGSLTMTGGIIAENGSCNFYDIYRRSGGIGLMNGTLDISGGVITGNETGVGGGIGAEKGSGSITISGGVIADNRTIYSGGGGVSADGSGYTVTIRDGALITGNIAQTGGGGVSTGGSALLQVAGGMITGNEAHTGGGINTDNLLMTGGIVAGNIARGNTGGDTNGDGEGGGIRVGGGKAEITGGHITNNETRTTVDWGGGGLFVSQSAAIKLQNLLVTGNEAQGLGGGVGGCSTGQVAISADDGLASFGNIAHGNKENGAHAAHKWEDQAALKNDDFLYYGSNDFFCAHSSYVTDAMLGGGSANWHGSQDTGAGYRGSSAADGAIDVKKLSIPQGGAAASQYLMGLSADPGTGDQDKAMKAAKVFITGNKSSTHGGGIMCNGVMFIGAISDTTVKFSSVPVEAGKVYQDMDGSPIELKGGEFAFALVAEDDFRIENGKPAYTNAQTAFNDENGKVLFTINGLTEKGTYTYYLVEIPGGRTVRYDTAIYKVTVEVTASQEISWKIDTKLTATVYSGKVKSITAMEIQDGQLTEKEAVESAVFTNVYDPQVTTQKGSLRIVKTVNGGGAAALAKTYVFTVTGPDGYSETVRITGSGEAVLDELKPGVYHVTEEDASLEGYNWTVSGGGDVIVRENAEASITITNTYTVPDQPTPPSGGGGGGGGGGGTPPAPPTPPTPEIPEEAVPLTDIPEEETPLAELPEVPEELEIPEEEVPLADVPETGDLGGGWMMAMLMGAMGLIWSALTAKSRKRPEDDAL